MTAQQQMMARRRALSQMTGPDWSGLLRRESAAGEGVAAPPEASVPTSMPTPGKTHFFIRGRGPTIDFGPIFKPRETGINPLEGNPYQATTGVSGFFRRLLGDNADELNAAWAQQRIMRQMAREDRAAMQQFELDKMAKAHENALALAEKEQAGRLTLAEKEQAGRMGAERYRAQTELERQGTADAQALIRLAQQTGAQRAMSAEEWATRKAMADAENATRSQIAESQVGADILRAVSPNERRYLNLGNGAFFDTETGTAFQPNLASETGGYLQFNLRGQPAAGSVPGAPPAGATAAPADNKPTAEQLNKVKSILGTPDLDELSGQARRLGVLTDEDEEKKRKQSMKDASQLQLTRPESSLPLIF